MKQVLIAGVSGAIGGALASRLLERDSQTRVIGLCRDPENAPDALRSHQRITLLPWDAESSAAPGAIAEEFALVPSRVKEIQNVTVL